MCIESKTSPLIKVDSNGEISCFNTLKEKLYAIENRSKKELEIQRKRRVWNIMRKKAEQALKEYKEEKGDFYKKEGV